MGSVWSIKRFPDGSMDDKGTGIIEKIPLPTNNSDFGSTHTMLTVSKENPNQSTSMIKDDAKIEVFYEKDGLDNPLGQEDGVTPNWFYYWKEKIHEIIPEDLNVLVYDYLEDSDSNAGTGDEGWKIKEINVNVKYDPNKPLVSLDSDGTSKLAGFAVRFEDFTKFNDGDDSPSGRALSDVNYDIVIGQLCSEVIGNKVIVGCSVCDYKDSFNVEGNVYTGVYAFLATMIHEFQHVKLFSDFWKSSHLIQAKNNPNKTDSDRDLYPDEWELTDEGKEYGFTVENIDNIENEEYDEDKYDLKYRSSEFPEIDKMASSGSNYEEITIRKFVNEQMNEELKTEWAKHDWSFIGKKHYLLFQGKQWKKED